MYIWLIPVQFFSDQDILKKIIISFQAHWKYVPVVIFLEIIRLLLTHFATLSK